jgi:pSer/pThr/pTyr-binding forkhead associated (FHA) protein
MDVTPPVVPQQGTFHLPLPILQMDPGSLNGTTLNGVIISASNRQPGEEHVLSDQDVLELGGSTKVKVCCRSQQPHWPKQRAGTIALEGS